MQTVSLRISLFQVKLMMRDRPNAWLTPLIPDAGVVYGILFSSSMGAWACRFAKAEDPNAFETQCFVLPGAERVHFTGDLA
jgi:hypothetical protein